MNFKEVAWLVVLDPMLLFVDPQYSPVSDQGVEGTGRDVCCVIQFRSGLSPLNRQETASTRIGNVGHPRMRQV
jgi:hypothetical protein